MSVGSITVRDVTNAEDEEHLVGHDDSGYCCVCARRLYRVQSTVKRCLLFTVGTSGGHFGNRESRTLRPSWSRLSIMTMCIVVSHILSLMSS